MRDYQKLIKSTDHAFQAWVQRLSDDLVVDNDVVVLYSMRSIPERNETFASQTYLPNHLIIGSDSGGMAFVIELKEGSPVWKVGEGSLHSDDFIEVAQSFSVWRNSGFALPEEPKYHLPLHADIYVNNVECLKIMFELKKLLSQNWGAGQMKKLLEGQPFLAIKSGSPIALEKELKMAPELKPFVLYLNGERLESVCS